MRSLNVSDDKDAVEAAIESHACGVVGPDLIDATWLTSLVTMDGGSMPAGRTLAHILTDMGYQQIEQRRIWLKRKTKHHYLWFRGGVHTGPAGDQPPPAPSAGTRRNAPGLIGQRTRAALAQVKARGVKLGGPNLRAGTPDMARLANAAYSRQQRQRAADVVPFIHQAQKAGATTLQLIADAMTARGIPTPGGRGGWHPATVARVLKAAA